MFNKKVLKEMFDFTTNKKKTIKTNKQIKKSISNNEIRYNRKNKWVFKRKKREYKKTKMRRNIYGTRNIYNWWY